MNKKYKLSDLIRSDYYRSYGKKVGLIKLTLYALAGTLFSIYTSFSYCFWLRLSSRKGILYPITRLIHYRMGIRFGLQINPKTKIGYGLHFAHPRGIIINPKTVIGNNCSIGQFTTIGTLSKGAAVIGDNVYIGPSVCIVGGVNIGSNVAIGAGSVVVKDIPDNTTVAGVPAKKISEKPNRWNSYKYEVTSS